MNTQEILEQISVLTEQAKSENSKQSNKAAQSRSRKLIKEIISLAKEYRVKSLEASK